VGNQDVETSQDAQGAKKEATEMTIDELGKEMDKMVVQELVNTNIVLDKLCFKSRKKSKLNIPLCRMKALAAVRPYLKNDVMALSTHFVSTGYMEGHGVFYVTLQDNEAKRMM